MTLLAAEVSRAGMVALITIGPIAVGVSALLLVAAGLVAFLFEDKQGFARFAVEAAITIFAGAVLIIGIAFLAL